MVLERAAKMAEAAPEISDNEELVKKGMKIAAEYLKSGESNLATTLAAEAAEEQAQIRKGIAQTLLRNIVLPRDETLEAEGQTALQGILSLSQNNGQVQSICQELAQILNQYGQHKDQTTQQLEEALKQQIQQQQMAMGQEVRDDINPAMHPKYKEELGKMLTNLNNQYNDAMNERKEMILQSLS